MGISTQSFLNGSLMSANFGRRRRDQFQVQLTIVADANGALLHYTLVNKAAVAEDSMRPYSACWGSLRYQQYAFTDIQKRPTVCGSMRLSARDSRWPQLTCFSFLSVPGVPHSGHP